MTLCIIAMGRVYWRASIEWAGHYWLSASRHLTVLWRYCSSYLRGASLFWTHWPQRSASLPPHAHETLFRTIALFLLCNQSLVYGMFVSLF